MSGHADSSFDGFDPDSGLGEVQLVSFSNMDPSNRVPSNIGFSAYATRVFLVELLRMSHTKFVSSQLSFSHDGGHSISSTLAIPRVSRILDVDLVTKRPFEGVHSFSINRTGLVRAGGCLTSTGRRYHNVVTTSHPLLSASLRLPR